MCIRDSLRIQHETGNDGIAIRRLWIQSPYNTLINLWNPDNHVNRLIWVNRHDNYSAHTTEQWITGRYFTLPITWMKQNLTISLKILDAIYAGTRNDWFTNITCNIQLRDSADKWHTVGDCGPGKLERGKTYSVITEYKDTWKQLRVVYANPKAVNGATDTIKISNITLSTEYGGIIERLHQGELSLERNIRNNYGEWGTWRSANFTLPAVNTDSNLVSLIENVYGGTGFLAPPTV